MKKRVLVPLPIQDFDPTEASVPWKILTQGNVEIIFATENAQIPKADERMLYGNGLGPLKTVLAADKTVVKTYGEMAESEEFRKPLSWQQALEVQVDGLLLPGGHAKGMVPYLESDLLQGLVANYFNQGKPVAAICHGVVLASRSKLNGQSVLWGKRTTALLKSQELLAWGLTCIWLGNYYRTYPVTVQDEVTASLKSKSDFVSGPIPISRDSESDLKPGFFVRDGNYLSARWPGNAHAFANEFLKMLGE
jgi:protease I